MVRRGDVQHETIEGEVTGIERWEEHDRLVVNTRMFSVTDLVLENLPTDVKDVVVGRFQRRMVHPGFKIQVFIDVKVKVVR